MFIIDGIIRRYLKNNKISYNLKTKEF